MSNFFSLVTELESLLEKLNTILAGSDNETVNVNGVNKDSISKAIKDNFAALQAMVNGRLSYETKSAMVSAGAPPNGELAEVWKDPAESFNGIYGYSAGEWVKSAYDIPTMIEKVSNLQFLDYKNYPCFIRNGSNDLSSLESYYAPDGFKRGHVYKSIKSLKLLEGFDKDWIMRVRVLWNDAYQSSGHNYFRFIIERWNGTGWIYVFDTGTLEMTELGWTNDQTVFFEGSSEISSTVRKLSAIIDLSLLPVNVAAILNSSTDLESTALIISPDCVISADTETVKKAKEKIESEGLDLSGSVFEAPFMSFSNDFISSIWIKYASDLSPLNTEYLPGYKKKLKYQAFKRLELYGFNKEQPHKLSYFWVDSYNPEQHKYRLIFEAFDGSSWNKVFDVSGDKEELGIVDGEIYTWIATYQGRKIIADIDFSNLAVNDGTALNPAEPTLIVSKLCFKSSIEDELLKYNSAKKVFRSKQKPTFAFIFDDLNATDKAVYKLFREFNFLPSFALKTGNLNASNADEYRDYYLNGCSILAHSVTHPVMSNTSISAENVDREMVDSKNAIESFGMKVSGWVTPSSVLHDSFLPLMEKNFGYGFTNKNAGVYNSTLEPIKMGRYGLESGMSNHNIEQVKLRVDSAIEKSELLVFYGHKLPSTYLNQDGTPYMTENDLRELLTYLKELSDDGQCLVLSCDEAVESYYSFS